MLKTKGCYYLWSWLQCCLKTNTRLQTEEQCCSP